MSKFLNYIGKYSFDCETKSGKICITTFWILLQCRTFSCIYFSATKEQRKIIVFNSIAAFIFSQLFLLKRPSLVSLKLFWAFLKVKNILHSFGSCLWSNKDRIWNISAKILWKWLVLISAHFCILQCLAVKGNLSITVF